MSSGDRELAERITRGIVAVTGVHGIFPQSGVASAVTPFFGTDRLQPAGVVAVARDGGRLVVSARLAIDADASTADVATAVARSIRRALDGAPFTLHLEVAHLV